MILSQRMGANVSRRAVRALDWDTVWRRVFLAGHVIGYGGIILTAGLQSEEYRYVTFAGTAIQVLAGVRAITWTHAIRYRILIVGLIGYTAALTAYGISQNNFLSYFAVDLLAFGLLTGIFMGVQPGVAGALTTLYGRLLLVGVPLSIYLATQLNASSADERLGGTLETNAFYIPVLCAPSLFIVLWPGIRSRLVSAVGIAGVLTTIGFGVVTLTRGAIVTPVIALGMRLLIGSNKRGLLMGVGALGALGLAGALSVWSAEQLGGSVDAVKFRFVGTDEFTSGRDREAAYFLSVLTPDEYVVGRGMGASYHGLIAANRQHGINMVHFGPLHLVLKGGLVLAGLVGLLCVIAMIVGYRSTVLAQRAAAAFVALFSVMNLMYTQFLPQPTMALFAVAVGVALAHRRWTADGRAEVVP